MSGPLSYAEALVIGAMQGVTELFPVSSLGHSVLVPAVIGGQWAADLNVSAPESPYLAFIVGLHVATALALLIYFWRDWVRIIGGLITSVRYRRVRTPDERLAWIIIIGTIPVGLIGLGLEHTFRTTLGRPIPAAVFLMINGLILLAAERRRRQPVPRPAMAVPMPVPTEGRGPVPAASRGTLYGRPRGGAVDVNPEPEDRVLTDQASDARISRRSIWETTLIASAQALALLPGISRSGVTMAAGLFRGLSHEDSARLSFLLATPVILAAGVLKIPSDLFGSLGNGIHGQVLAGSLASGVGAYLSVRFLTKYFQTRTLIPFAIYCLVAGGAALLWLTLR
jgi:undecaprenyl-diphosphatase